MVQGYFPLQYSLTKPIDAISSLSTKELPVVERLPDNPKIQGSNPAAASSGRDKMAMKRTNGFEN